MLRGMKSVSCAFAVCSDVVSNNGHYPMNKGEAQSFLSTGPMCRFAADLLPLFKLLVMPQHRMKLRLDESVSRLVYGCR